MGDRETTPERIEGRSNAGRVVVITGAGSGIGRAAAELFALDGAIVYATDRYVGGVEELAATHRVTARPVDVTSKDDIDALVDEIERDHGRLDVLVNNAGFALPAVIGTDDYLDAWTNSIDGMLAGPMRTIHAMLPLLRRSDAARIVNVSSTEGVGGSAGNSPYTAAKHGVIGLTRSLAVELGPEAITVNAVCPGPVRTGITAGIPDEMKDKFARRRVPLRRYGEPIEIAHAIVHLSLPASSYITGHALLVDGGMTIKNN